MVQKFVNKKVYRLDLLIENIEYTASLSHVQPTSFWWLVWSDFHRWRHLLFQFYKNSSEIDICHLIIRILLVNMSVIDEFWSEYQMALLLLFGFIKNSSCCSHLLLPTRIFVSRLYLKNSTIISVGRIRWQWNSDL